MMTSIYIVEDEDHIILGAYSTKEGAENKRIILGEEEAKHEYKRYERAIESYNLRIAEARNFFKIAPETTDDDIANLLKLYKPREPKTENYRYWFNIREVELECMSPANWLVRYFRSSKYVHEAILAYNKKKAG